MRKLSVLFVFCICTFYGSGQKLQSPGQFLGYSLGSHFTPHFRIVNYFRHVAESVPDMVKLEQYGETYEGRPLLLAYVASPENLQKLDAIRLNNLRLAGMVKDKIPADGNAPAIVWLSYNVHGNEAASSEAAMKTIYELVSPSDAQTKEWLKHVVVIIDPCINPDGRDRYVNWYNTIVGKNANEDPQSREHFEPWPGGRTNHYNFDLNRDWAWQTQIETQQRLKKYNEWLPQVHVDYHEQGFNAPYYFAPAAEPYHEVITPWQRAFQAEIGKNNAKYFDQHEWLFFTKERFDLFYPSYGDTYPIYSGAIGMTFEQGGIRAGLAITTRSGDTLTLADRLMHHFTTGMSTIEITALNAAKVIDEYKKYFDNARTKPYGEYKSFLIKTDPLTDKSERLKSLLDKNLIEWGYISSGSFTGFNYLTGKTEPFKAEPGDIAINMDQPKSNLIKVLFERNSKISDSDTYDITAWSVPFAYGLKAYGLNSYVSGTSTNAPVPAITYDIPATAYAYAVRWTGLNSACFLAGLLKKGMKVRYAEQAFQSGSQHFEKGTLIIMLTSNGSFQKDFYSVIRDEAQKAKVELLPVQSGLVEKGHDFGSDRIHLIHKLKVAMLTGSGVSSNEAGEVWHFFDQQLDYPVSLISTDDFGRVSLKNYDVLIMPDGYYKLFDNKNEAEQLKDWISQGGKLIALQNAVQQLSKSDWGIKEKNTEDKKEGDNKNDYSLLRRYENRERDDLSESTPGAIYKVELDNSHPLAFGYPDYYYTLKLDDNVYGFLKGDGWNVGVIKKDNYVSGFAGSKAKEKLKDGLIFGVQGLGRGQIVYLADDPLFRSFWENGKLLFCNAVFMVGE